VEDSALVIPVTLPPKLATVRGAYDPGASVLPAHITIIVPFCPPSDREAVRPILARLAESVPSFHLWTDGVGLFPGPDLHTVYLRVAPEEPIQRLIRSVHNRFQDYPPYRGRHQEVVPHITVARVQTGQVGEAFHQACQAFREEGERIWFAAENLEWITGEGGSEVDTFALRPEK
jgi:2'-5' RNA ligase